MSWRCPHCETPQPEASRCWVCHRSSTSCATCRHYRGSVAARTGYCGLDRRRLPLLGDEVRPCWEDVATPVAFDPPIPGLLDLLTEPVLGQTVTPAEEPARTAAAPRGRPAPDAPRDSLRLRRDWVEVEA